LTVLTLTQHLNTVKPKVSEHSLLIIVYCGFRWSTNALQLIREREREREHSLVCLPVLMSPSVNLIAHK